MKRFCDTQNYLDKRIFDVRYWESNGMFIGFDNVVPPLS